MHRRSLFVVSLFVGHLSACGDSLRCGEGTRRQGDECVASSQAGAAPGAGSRDQATPTSGAAGGAAGAAESDPTPPSASCGAPGQSTPGQPGDPCANAGCPAIAECRSDGTWGECVCAPGWEPTCGNGIIEPGETCEGADLGGWSCATLLGTEGILGCSDRCHLDQTTCARDRPAVNNCPAPSECRTIEGGGDRTYCVEPDTGRPPVCNDDDTCPYGICNHTGTMWPCLLPCTSG